MSRERLQFDGILWSLLAAMPSEDNRLKFDARSFQDQWSKIDSLLQATSIEIVTIAPIPGLFGNFPIQLAPGLELDSFTSDEVTRCVNMSLLHSFVQGQELIRAEQAVGVRYKLSDPKVAGDSQAEVPRGWFGHRATFESFLIVDDVLAMLRLFQSGTAECTGSLSFFDRWLLQGSTHTHHRKSRPHLFASYRIASDATDTLKQLWQLLTSGVLENHSFIEVALRRFSMAWERSLIEDRMIDLMIAAEALFLSGPGSRKDRGEMRFRLALRAACFVETAGMSRRETFGLMRDAYDVRSSVVHGGHMEEVNIIKKRSVSADVFTTAVGDVVRRAILKAIATPEIGQDNFWDDLIFPYTMT